MNFVVEDMVTVMPTVSVVLRSVETTTITVASNNTHNVNILHAQVYIIMKTFVHVCLQHCDYNFYKSKITHKCGPSKKGKQLYPSLIFLRQNI